MADLITGYGVAESIIHYYRIFKQSDVTNKRVIIQGWGNVASAAGLYLSGWCQNSRHHRPGRGLLRLRDWQEAQVEKLFLDKNNRPTGDIISFEEVKENLANTQIYFCARCCFQNCEQTAGRRFGKCWLWGNCPGANVPFQMTNILWWNSALARWKYCTYPGFCGKLWDGKGFCLLNARRGRFDRLWHISRRFTYNWHVFEDLFRENREPPEFLNDLCSKVYKTWLKILCILMNKTTFVVQRKNINNFPMTRKIYVYALLFLGRHLVRTGWYEKTRRMQVSAWVSPLHSQAKKMLGSWVFMLVTFSSMVTWTGQYLEVMVLVFTWGKQFTTLFLSGQTCSTVPQLVLSHNLGHMQL